MRIKQNALNGFILKLIDKFHAEQDRWFLTLPIFLSLGIAFYMLHSIEVSWIPLAAFLTLFIVIAWRYQQKSHALYPVFVIIALILSGFALAKIKTETIEAPVLYKEIGPIMVEGTLEEIEYLPKGARILLDNVTIQKLSPDNTPKKVRIKIWSYDENVGVGDRVEVLAKLAPPSGPVIPGGYDFRKDLYYKQIGGLGFGLKQLTVLQHKSYDGSLMNDWRAKIAKKIIAVQTPAAAQVSIALTVGEQSGIPKNVVTDMRSVGLAHLLSISGLHLALMTGVVFFCVRFMLSLIPLIALRFDVKKWAAILAIAAGWFYMLLAGSPIPTQRSFIMVSIIFLAILVDRQAFSLRTVAIAALIILFFHPEALFNVGFQLSFSAVVLLIAGFEYMTEKKWIGRSESWVGRLFSYFLGIMITTTLAQIATTFIALYHFNQFNTYGQLANLIAIPVTGFLIMPFVILSLIAMPFGLEALPLNIMEIGVDIIINASHEIASWPHAILLYPRFSFWALMLIVMGGLWWCIWKKPWRHYGLVAFAIGAILIFLTPVRHDVIVDAEGKTFAVYDQHQGLFLSSIKSNQFATDKWIAAYAEKEKKPLTALQPSSNISCDGEGCILKRGNQSLAIVASVAALQEECGKHTKIINLTRSKEICLDQGVINFPQSQAVGFNLN